MTKTADRNPSADSGTIRRLRLMAGVLLCALACAGCGWQPLYARPSPDPVSGGVGAALARISIDPVATRDNPDPLTGSDQALYDSRAAQMLQNHLKDSLNPYGPPQSPAYHLAVELRQAVRGTLSLGNGEVTREELVMTAYYKLNDAGGKAVLNDLAQIVTSYDVLQEPFSDLSSKADAARRGTEQLAVAIQTRLAVFLGK